jgi:hypothetical protein
VVVRDEFYGFLSEQMKELAEQAHKQLGAEHEQTFACQMEHARLKERCNGRTEAIAAIRPVLSEMQRALGHRHWRVLEAQNALGRWLLDEREYDEACSLLAITYADLRRNGAGDRETLLAGMNFARSLAERGDVEAGCQTAVEVIAAGVDHGADTRQLLRYSGIAEEWMDRWRRALAPIK